MEIVILKDFYNWQEVNQIFNMLLIITVFPGFKWPPFHLFNNINPC